MCRLERATCTVHLKSDNLQYNTLGCWVNGTNDSSTKRLMFQALFLFIISYRLRAKNFTRNFENKIIPYVPSILSQLLGNLSTGRHTVLVYVLKFPRSWLNIDGTYGMLHQTCYHNPDLYRLCSRLSKICPLE